MKWRQNDLTFVRLIRRILFCLIVSSFCDTLIEPTFAIDSYPFDHHHNSPPVFNFKRDWTIRDDEVIGHKVASVLASDTDGDDIIYGLEAGLFRDGSHYFTINPNNGQVFLKQSLTGQAGNDFYLLVTADDGYHTAKIEVNVRVIGKDVSPVLTKPRHPFSSFPSPSYSNFGNGINQGYPLNYPSIFQPPRPFSPVDAIGDKPITSTSSTSTTSTTTTSTTLITSTTSKPSTVSKTITKVSTTTPLPSQSTSKVITTPKTTPSAKLPTKLITLKLSTTSTTLPTLNFSVSTKISDKVDNSSSDESIIQQSTELNQNSNHSYHHHFNRSSKLIVDWLPLLIIIAFVVLIVLIIYGVLRICCNRHENSIKSTSWPMMVKTPANKCDSIETTVCSVASDSDYKGDLFYQSSSIVGLITRYDDANLLGPSASLQPDFNFPVIPSDLKKWEFPRHHLRLLGILGEGCFGRVWKCEAYTIAGNEGATLVAVKTIKESASEREKADLICELEIMAQLEPHPNVVSLLGCCTQIEPRFLILEYVPFGTLQSYLRDNRSERFYGNILGSFTSRDLTSFAYQIAKGMEYISSKGIIHRDLAARNILIGNNKTCKISDFGFSRKVTANQIYEHKSQGRLPIRWMAPEALYENVFTIKGDVWSFGIVMWEIVTLGSTPYPGLSTKEVMIKVRDGYRLDKPDHCKREVYNIMFYCWAKSPDERPTFTDLVKLVDNLVTSENDYIELDRFPDHSYYNVITNLSGEKL